MCDDKILLYANLCFLQTQVRADGGGGAINLVKCRAFVTGKRLAYAAKAVNFSMISYEEIKNKATVKNTASRREINC